MGIADKSTYLLDVVEALNRKWPDNRTVNIVCHGHSVPAGYAATPHVNTFDAYPHLLHRGLKERHPFAVLNVIVTAIGGENSASGAERFPKEVLNHTPDVVTIDYGLNDRGIGRMKAMDAWRRMVEQSIAHGSKVVLLTPSMEIPGFYGPMEKEWEPLEQHAEQIRLLAREYGVGLADTYCSFSQYKENAGEISDLLSSINHPCRRGHERIVLELLRWFPLVWSANA